MDRCLIFTFFRDFDNDNATQRIYDIWNFGKATNEVLHPGNIPQEIIDNPLYKTSLNEDTTRTLILLHELSL